MWFFSWLCVTLNCFITYSLSFDWLLDTVMRYYWLSRFCFIPSQRLDIFQSICASAWSFWGLFLSVVKVGQKYLLLWGYFGSTPWGLTILVSLLNALGAKRISFYSSSWKSLSDLCESWELLSIQLPGSCSLSGLMEIYPINVWCNIQSKIQGINV